MVLDLPLARLRARRSVKWQFYGPDVLPLWVAEMDVDLAPAIHDVLTSMVAGSDTGYAWPGDVAEAYAGFARRRWSLAVGPDRVYVLQDVMRGVLEVLRTALPPGRGVVVNPPVYAPFYAAVERAGHRVVEVPLRREPDLRYGLDLAGLADAFAAGAAAYLLCSPHNPVGRLWSRAELAAVVELCAEHGVLLLADEIHAPLVPGGGFVPVHTLPGAQDAISLMSASKAWNLAGLKCALAVAASERGWDTVQAIGQEVSFGTGILGVAAASAAFRDGEAWLDEVVGEIGARHTLLGDLLAEHLPTVRCRRSEATFLAWLDVRELGLADPAAAFLRAGVAVEPGPKFGTGGAGFVRLNVACSTDVLEQAVRAMARAT